MSDRLQLDWSDVATARRSKKSKKTDKDVTFSKELGDLQRTLRASGKGADAIARAVEKGLAAWNEAWDEAEAEVDDGPVRNAVDLWAAGTSATLEGLAKAPTAFAEAWDVPVKPRRVRKLMPKMLRLS